jgi:hypothetical protein
VTDIGPIAHLEIDGQDMTPYIHTEPWTLEHRVHLFNQDEVRPGPPDSDGTRWVERRLTGKANAVCNCGWSSGWMDRDELLAMREQLKTEHPSYLDQGHDGEESRG